VMPPLAGPTPNTQSCWKMNWPHAIVFIADSDERIMTPTVVSLIVKECL